MGKRIASLLLSLVMMLSLLPTTVYAAAGTADKNGVSVVGSAAPDAAQEEGVDNAAAGEGENGDVSENGDVGEDGGDAADSALTTQSGDTEMTVTYAAGETGTVVAKIGAKEYATLADAIADAAEGDTITLVANTELTESLTVNTTVTLNLAGCTITGVLTIGTNGNLTIVDSVGSGKITSTGTTITANGGTLTLNGGTIESTSTSSSSAAIALAFNVISAVHINNGVVQNSAKGGVAIIVKNGSFATLTVANGTVSGDTYGIDLWKSTEVSEIAGGTITGGTAAIRMRANAKLNAIGGEIKGIGISGGSTALTIGKNENGAASDVTVDWVDLKHDSYSANAATVNLYSGTVKEFLNCGSMTVKEVGKDGAFLTGTDITSRLPGADLKCVEGADGLYYVTNLSDENAEAKVLHDGKETAYNTVGQAVTALQDGDTLTLNTDYTGTIAVQEKNIVIDLGGHTVTATGLQDNAVNIAQSATESNTVTVKNGHLVAKDQSASAIHAIMNDATSETLTLALEDVTLELSHPSAKQSLVRLGNGARTAVANKAYVTNGGLQVAESDGTWIYGTTNTAFTHANGSTVTLLNDWYNTDSDGAVRVPEDASYTSAVLDLNGNTIGYYGSVSAIAIGGSGNNYVDGTNAKSLTVKNGTINANSGSGAAIGGSNKTLILDGVTLTTTGTEKCGIFTNGMTTGNTVTLKNKTTVTSNAGTGIYFPGAGTLTVENANVTGSVSGIEIRAGELHVSGDSAIKSTAAEFKFEDNDNGTTTTGAAIAAVKHGVGNDLTVNIDGGTFTGPTALYQADPNTDKAGTVTMSVTGGTFDGAVTAEKTKFISGGTFTAGVDETYLADGYVYNAADKTVKADTSVAAIGTTKYATLKEAINAANTGDTITLLDDVDLDKNGQYLYSTATDKKNVCNLTFDLNGYKITSFNSYTVSASREGLVIKNGTIENTASKTTYGAIYAPFSTKGTHSLTLENVTVIAKDTGIYATTANGDATVTIGDKTTINAATGIEVVGADTKARTGTLKLNVSAGTVTGTKCGIHVTGPTNKNEIAAVTVNITGGEVSSVTTETGSNKRGANVIISGGTVTGALKNAGKDVITITGGTFKGAVTKLDTNGTIAISGGKFTIKPDTTYLTEGYTITENADNTYGVKKTTYVAEVNGTQYTSLQAAIDAAGRKTTVTMLADTRENVTISTSDLTLDLNGRTLNGGTVANKPALTVTARVTVKDSSEKQTGTIMREDTAENSGDSSHYVIDVQGDGWLTFEGGNVKNNSGIVGVTGASLVRVGDDSVAKFPGLNIKGGTFTQDNFIVIKVDRGDLFLNDGTLNSANSYAIEDWHRATVKGGTVNGAVAAWTYSGGYNSDLEISGGTINGDVTSVNYGSAEGKVAKVSITGGTVNGELDTRSYDPETGELTHSDDAAKATIKVTGGTFAKDPSTYVVEDSAVKPNTDGTFGVEKAYLAKVGETSYYTMDEAFKAQTASGEAIFLLRDYTTGGTFNSGSINRTVNLNGHTWTCTGTDANSAAFEINHPNATLTVTNGKVVSSQLVGLIPSAMGGTIKYDNSGLVFEGVEMSTTATSGIETNGNNTNDTVTLRNSTLNVPNGFGIYFPSSGTLTIDNSTITAKTMGVQVCAGSLSITGEKTAITVTGDAVEKTEGDGAIQDGAAISIVNRNGYKGFGEIAVTGGTFTAKSGNAAIKAYDWNNTTKTEETFSKSEKVAVSGGTFSSIPDNMDGLCKDGFVPVKNADGYAVQTGTYVASIGTKKFATLAEAVEAAKDGDTVKLLADVEQNARLVINKSITLDLNGKKICNTRDIWKESNALIGIGTDETRVKVIITGNGTIKAKENDCYTIDVKNGDLTIENGEFIGNVSAVQVQVGTLTINDGKFSLLQKMTDGKGENRYLINCIDGKFADGSAKVAIYGGTFEGFDPNVSPEKQVDGKAPSFAAEGVGIRRTGDSFVAVRDKVAQTLDANGNSVYCYSSLESALGLLEVKDGYTVRVLQDITVENQLPAVKSSITIDGQGYTVTLDDSCYVTYYISVEQNNKLKLSNVTITGATDMAPLLHIKGNAEVTIDKDSSIIATGDNKDSNPAIFIGIENGASGTAPTLNIYGRVEGNRRGIIAGNGTDNGTSHINIYDGAVVKSESLAMFLPQPCEVNITGGTVEGYCAIGIKSGTLNITGGQVLGVADDNELSDNNSVGSGMQYDGSAIVIDSHTGYKGNVNINISGSAFIQSRCSTGIREIGNNPDKTNVTRLSISGGTVLSGSGMDAVKVREVTKNNVSITGGRFSTNVAAYCASGYQCNKPTEDEPLYTVTKKDAVVTVSRKLTLANNLIITYTAKMPANYAEPYAEFNFWNNSLNEWQTSKVVGVANGVDADGNATYTFAFTGVNPQRMNDTLKMTLFAKTTGSTEFVAITKEYTDSVAAYCNAVINNSTYNVNGRWTEVLSNLVAYGAASQKYMKYNETALVTDSVLNCVTKDYTGTQEIAEVSGVSRKDGGITITSVGMVLSSSYAVRVFFTLNDTTSLSDVTFTASIGGSSEQSFSKDDFTEQSYNGGTRYYFDYTGLNARQLDSEITFTATVSGTQDDTLGYSANTYLQYYITNNPSANTVWNELVKWLFNYGWSCKNFK